MKYIKYFESTIEDYRQIRLWDNPQIGDIVKCISNGPSKLLILNKLYTIKTIINNDPVVNKYLSTGTFYTFEEILPTHSYYDYHFVKIPKEEAEEYKIKKSMSKFNL